MIEYKIMDILDEQVYFQDKTGTIYSTVCIELPTPISSSTFFERSGLITEKSWRYGYTAKTRTDDKILVSICARLFADICDSFAVSVVYRSLCHIVLCILMGYSISAFLFFPLIFACTDIINEPMITLGSNMSSMQHQGVWCLWLGS